MFSLRKPASIILFPALIVMLYACGQEDEVGPEEVSGNIEGIYFQQYYSIDFSGNFYSYFEPFLLLKDGGIKQQLDTPPEQVDFETSRQDETELWGVWENWDNIIYITWNDGDTEEWEDWYVGHPASEGETIEGLYESIGTLIVTQGIAAEHIYFNQDGTFELLKSNVYAESDILLTGQYLLKGYGLTLIYEDGTQEEKSFAFFENASEKDTKALFINDDTYLRQD
jgi:hypothetical protein